MNPMKTFIACLVLGLVAQTGIAQESNPAAQRAAIANERIQAEAARQRELEEARARAEQEAAERQARAESEQAEAERRRQAEQARMEAEQARRETAAGEAADIVPVVRSTRPAPPRPPASERPRTLPSTETGRDMAAAMDQIRQLGEMRDAGYLSKKEFEQLKKKILDDLL